MFVIVSQFMFVLMVVFSILNLVKKFSIGGMFVRLNISISMVSVLVGFVYVKWFSEVRLVIGMLLCFSDRMKVKVLIFMIVQMVMQISMFCMLSCVFVVRLISVKFICVIEEQVISCLILVWLILVIELRNIDMMVSVVMIWF